VGVVAGAEVGAWARSGRFRGRARDTNCPASDVLLTAETRDEEFWLRLRVIGRRLPGRAGVGQARTAHPGPHVPMARAHVS
jgi:hypothetical protein